MAGRAPASGVGQQTLDRIHHVVDAAHRLELFRLDLLAGQLLQVHHQIDGVYAVELEILIEAGLGGDGLFVDLEQLDEGELARLLELLAGTKKDNPLNNES